MSGPHLSQAVVVAPSVNAAGTIPRFMSAVRQSSAAAPTTLRIIGLGSSVGLGATLPAPSTQAPVAKLAELLGAAVNGSGDLNITVTNGSVGGAVIINANQGNYTAAKTSAGGTPHLLALAYGMNDGTPAQYHDGQTRTGAYTQYANLIATARNEGSDVVLMTTPHPHSTRQNWTTPPGAIVYPSGGVAIPALTYADSVATRDWLGNGRLVPGSIRHAQINADMRQVAIDLKAALIDVEPYWFDAISVYGEDALFDTGEFVHPNLLGHQMSYWRAIEDWTKSMQNGRSALALLPDEGVKTRDVIVASGGTLAIPVQANRYGELTIFATAGGSWYSGWKGMFFSSAAAVGVAEYGTGFITPGNAVASVAGSGTTLNITLTTTAIGTSINLEYIINYF